MPLSFETTSLKTHCRNLDLTQVDQTQASCGTLTNISPFNQEKLNFRCFFWCFFHYRQYTNAFLMQKGTVPIRKTQILFFSARSRRKKPPFVSVISKEVQIRKIP